MGPQAGPTGEETRGGGRRKTGRMGTVGDERRRTER